MTLERKEEAYKRANLIMAYQDCIDHLMHDCDEDMLKAITFYIGFKEGRIDKETARVLIEGCE